MTYIYLYQGKRLVKGQKAKSSDVWSEESVALSSLEVVLERRKAKTARTRTLMRIGDTVIFWWGCREVSQITKSKKKLRNRRSMAGLENAPEREIKRPENQEPEAGIYKHLRRQCRSRR